MKTTTVKSANRTQLAVSIQAHKTSATINNHHRVSREQSQIELNYRSGIKEARVQAVATRVKEFIKIHTRFNLVDPKSAYFTHGKYIYQICRYVLNMSSNNKKNLTRYFISHQLQI